MSGSETPRTATAPTRPEAAPGATVGTGGDGGSASRRALLTGSAAGLGLAVVGALRPGAVLAQDFRIRTGDSLRIEVLEDPTLNRSVLVLPDGSIDFPLAGTLRAAGRTVDELRQSLVSELAENFAADPTVFVAVNALAPPPEAPPPLPPGPEPEPVTVDVFVTGEVADPGAKAVPPGTTILQIIAVAGGLTRFAAERRIQLRRVDPQTHQVRTFNYDFRQTGHVPSISGATRLAPGDVVVVPERRLFEF